MLTSVFLTPRPSYDALPRSPKTPGAALPKLPLPRRFTSRPSPLNPSASPELRPRTHERPMKSGQSPAQRKLSLGAAAQSPEGYSDGPQRPPIRPVVGQKSSRFDLEPNPFEQSFSNPPNKEAREGTPPRGGEATSLKHNALPPLASLTSPAAADPLQFPWLANQSLRTGPLSPAMLAGPQPSSGNDVPPHHSSNLREGNGGNPEPFDTPFRTGFTPGTGSGFTPGYTSLMAGNFASSLPMPSPNTAAFLNMVTNGTPIEGHAGGQESSTTSDSQSHSHDQPPSAIPPHMQPSGHPHGLAHINANPNMSQETITPNTLSALTGVFNDMNRSNAPPFYPPAVMGPPGPPVAPIHPHAHPHPPVDYAQQSANAASQAANGLFLLSQAHQELSKREEEGRGDRRTSVGSTTKMTGTKRKSDTGVGGQKGAKRGKKMSEPLNKEESTSPTFSFSEDDERKPDGRPETEEEKRKNFLERNRQAALKCRQRKKAWLHELQIKCEALTVDNERLQQTIAGLHDEVSRLGNMLMQHRDCGLGIPTGYGRMGR
ncbi:hypothetical protein M231_06748 [Tremella mesenterica]|uniref:BZIP domain-containing protein n=1 Tax=Tremella mesenterica TaxID=5217 RepID=A0A4Q1BB06_TREME|nr:hypothetical protein M231_06748 [Tremella mesenterica]